MKIKISNLVITDYCSTDKRKIRFIKEIKEDPLICHFVSNFIDNHLKESEGSTELLVGPAYIIEDKRKLVGFIRCAFLDFDGVLNLHYAVHPSYRRMHYGSKMLLDVSKYILKNMSVNAIELYIKDINSGSIKCAKNANFTFDRSFQTSIDGKINVYILKK